MGWGGLLRWVAVAGGGRIATATATAGNCARQHLCARSHRGPADTALVAEVRPLPGSLGPGGTSAAKAVPAQKTPRLPTRVSSEPPVEVS